MLVNPFGPVHVKFGTPLAVLVALNIRSKPLHSWRWGWVWIC